MYKAAHMALSVYEYEDPSCYLKDAWAEKKKKNPSFSMRSWAKNLGFSNNTVLSLILNGKRPVPARHIPQFIESLDLSKAEGLYLETLIAFKNAKSAKEKSYFADRMNELNNGQPFKMFEIESFKFLSNPLHALIIEMTALKNFKPDPKWIVPKLRIKATLSEVSEAIKRCQALGFIKKTPQGTWEKSQAHISNRVDVVDSGSQEYHKNVSLLAAQEVSKQTIQNREFNGYALNFNVKDLPRAKKSIRKFIADFIEEYESPTKKGEETYQFNVQLFALTQNLSEGDIK